jgi:hypothetical protein
MPPVIIVQNSVLKNFGGFDAPSDGFSVTVFCKRFFLQFIKNAGDAEE